MERIILVLTYVGVAMGAGAYNWTYHENGPTGPKMWPSIYPSCNGSSQSPINIVTPGVQYDSNLGQLNFVNYDNIPAGANIRVRNNGFSFIVDLLSSMKYFVNGGGLPGNFSTFQFHFHWGSAHHRGSEHTIDGTVFPGVIHVLSYNIKYASIWDAVNKTDGLAALGILLQVGAENAALDQVFQYIGNVTTVSNITNVPQSFNLGSIFPANKDFYRYSGSVTTPYCYESVTWTVFKTQVNISTSQLVKLRTLKEADGVTALQDNYRPEQPLNGRLVKSNFVLPKTATSHTPATSPTAAVQPTSGVSTTMATMWIVLMVTFISKFF